MDANRYSAVLYLLFWLVRMNGCVRRGRQPLLRGRAWFFDVHVRPDFYTGAGRAILHRYWMRMCIPFAVDIPFAAAIVVSGRLVALNWLIVVVSVVIHVCHLWSVDLAERQARAFAIPESEQPVSRVTLSLEPRRLRDFANPAFEWALALSLLLASGWLIHYYKSAPGHRSLRLVFGVPALLLYLQAGMLLIKRVVLEWRSLLPTDHAAEHFEVRQEIRKYYLRTCDWYRGAAAAALLFWPIRLSASPSEVTRLIGVWLAAWMVIGLIASVWVEFKRKHLVRLSLRADPVKLPDLLRQAEIARWQVCYQPSAPILMLKGARGYSLNLANRLAQWCAAYAAGFVALVVVLHMAR